MVGLHDLLMKDKKLVIGLMSGTSVDGIDAALVEIEGYGLNTKVKLLHFINFPYEFHMRRRIMALFNSQSVKEICHMNFLIGDLFADACIKLCADYGIDVREIDLIGSHGQTIYHIPDPVEDGGRLIRSTLQIGETAVISQRTGAVTVGDFRVRDMAAGGHGAPLVPYTEYLLYRSKDENIALQNIGGIGNITVIPKNCALSDIIAFDTGPGNMVIDAAVYELTGGRLTYDKDGQLAFSGKVDERLLDFLMNDQYLMTKPPKTTGREYYGIEYTKRLLAKARRFGISMEDTIATATAFTAKTIAFSISNYIPQKYMPQTLIIGGGGSYNPCLMNHLKSSLPHIHVIRNEDIGFNSDAKEAVAFAILANEAIHSSCSNVPSATGASKPVILGKISQ